MTTGMENKIMKKSLLIVAALAVAIATVPMFAAFEAHIINVTAQIENALSVDTQHIDFGTVFPQEKMYEEICIELSGSFMSEGRVDDVTYVIKQKPKPRTEPDRQLPILKPNINDYMDAGDFVALYPHFIDDDGLREQYCHQMRPADAGDPSDSYYINCYPILASMLSKHKADDDNDRPTDQAPYDTEVDAPDPNWEQAVAKGYLTKEAGDIEDHWVIDLVVPCFEGMCDQAYTVDEFGQPLDPRLEHSVFGADLWIEVTGISETCQDCS